ncbi:DUF86 domain-containing protein [Rhizobium sp. TH2]|uniref:HepT-like ribonuclease domain-containing protein n=1 Tax=Rhizobium sp. TH2 TaxID=2775403 RepID=UPI0021577A1F|nr:HepT-like ribonuclease domain-containing protein [Rhizobium sp. TH2]UVC11353.1 DUF86 domain-containing protein [Rhizobium sp. TH2]
MLHEDRIRLRHMRESAVVATHFLKGRSRGDLEADLQFQFALVRAIEIVGEAASKISEDTRRANPEIEWQLIISMRNRLIHAYFDVSTDILWNTATEALPPLIQQLNALLEE